MERTAGVGGSGQERAGAVRADAPDAVCSGSGAEADDGVCSLLRRSSKRFTERNPVGQRSVRLVAGMLGGLTIYGDEQAARLVTRRRAAGRRLRRTCCCTAMPMCSCLPTTTARRRSWCSFGPSGCSVVSDERGWPAAYLYRAGGQAARIAADGRARAAAGGACEERCIRATTIMGWAASRRRSPAASVHNRASQVEQGAARQCGAAERGAESMSRATERCCRASSSTRLKDELAEEFSGQRQCRAAAAARGRAEVAGAEPDAGGHGFRRAEGRRGAGHRAGVRSAAGAGRASRRCDLCQCARGGAGAVPADDPADGGADPGRAVARC